MTTESSQQTMTGESSRTKIRHQTQQPQQLQQKVISDEIDWLGNTCLHNLFVNYDIDLVYLKKVLTEFPHLALIPNLLGRIPLHYAVDHGKVNLAALEILINAHPEGIVVKDSEDRTPYDLVKKWEHNKTIQWLFLSKRPDIDHSQYLKLKYGPLGSLAAWANKSQVQSSDTIGTIDMVTEEEECEEDDVDGENEGEEELDGIKEEENASVTEVRSSLDNDKLQDNRRYSVCEVTEFESYPSNDNVNEEINERNSSSVTSPIPPHLFTLPPSDNSPYVRSAQSRHVSIASVRSFDDTEENLDV